VVDLAFRESCTERFDDERVESLSSECVSLMTAERGSRVSFGFSRKGLLGRLTDHNLE